MVNPFPYPGPIPLYTNLPINAQFYLPSRFIIEDITRGFTTLITTTVDHDYVVGQLVRTLIPSSCGTYQLNESEGYVLSIPQSDQVVIDIDSRQMDSFITITPDNRNLSYPQIIAIGDISSGAINTSGSMNLINFIPGSFINISPA